MKTRDDLMGRISDVLRRLEAPDAEKIIRLLELNLPAQLVTDTDPVIAALRKGNFLEAVHQHIMATGASIVEARAAVAIVNKSLGTPAKSGAD